MLGFRFDFNRRKSISFKYYSSHGYNFNYFFFLFIQPVSCRKLNPDASSPPFPFELLFYGSRTMDPTWVDEKGLNSHCPRVSLIIFATDEESFVCV